MPFRNMQSKIVLDKIFFAIHFRISQSVHLGEKAQDGRTQVRPKLHRCAVKLQKKPLLVISLAPDITQVRRRFHTLAGGRGGAPPPPLSMARCAPS